MAPSVVASRSSSQSSQAGLSASERTALLAAAPSSSTSAQTPPKSAHAHAPNHQRVAGGHDRKGSISARSVSSRYGSILASPSPVDKVARFSPAGQRLRLQTGLHKFAQYSTISGTILCAIFSLLLFLNAALDWTIPGLAYRGSGYTELWLALIGFWIGLGGSLFFYRPTYTFFRTTLVTFLLLPVLLLLCLLCPIPRARHFPFILLPLAIAAFTLFSTLLSSYLVRRTKRKEGEKICRMLTEAAQREQAEAGDIAKVLIGLSSETWAGMTVNFVWAVVTFVAGMAGLVVMLALVFDLGLVAFDYTVDLPSSHSKLISVQPAVSPWHISVHLACFDAPRPRNTSEANLTSDLADLPTVLYEPDVGTPGTLALYHHALEPGPRNIENPGHWLLELQEDQLVGRVCLWDRPGYGWSDVLHRADLGSVASTLWAALDEAGETKGKKFLLVGEGYGSLVTRLFAAHRPAAVHSSLHLEAETAQTYFQPIASHLPAPLAQAKHALTHLLPNLLTPLSIHRLPSAMFRQSTSESRILASVYPSRSARLSETLEKARFQESADARSHTSTSLRALLDSWGTFPADRPAIVLSSQTRMDSNEDWAAGQEQLAKGVISEEGLVAWEQVKGVGRHICEGEGRAACGKALERLLKLRK